MPRCRRFAAGFALVLAMLALRAGLVHAGDPNPSAAPPGDSSVAAAIARGKELGAEVLRLQEQGKSAEAIPIAREALLTIERVLGASHPDVATALDNLASVLQDRGAFGEAQPLYERAISIRERSLGSDHLLVAESVNNLATLHHALGAYPVARRLYERAIGIRERALGRDDPSIAPLLNNLADLSRLQGEYVLARALAERAIAIKVKALGESDPSIARSLNNLAALVDAQGAYGEATSLYERALAIFEKAYGGRHPLVAAALNNLAQHLVAGSEYAAARPLLERSISLLEELAGADHPDVATGLSNLGLLLYQQGSLEEARPLFDRALAIREAALGAAHADVGTALVNLADLLLLQGDFRSALPLLERAVSIYERALGAAHPIVATGLTTLSRALEAAGDFERAESMLQRASSIRERALGKEHPDVAASLNSWGSFLRRRGRLREARGPMIRAIETRERLFGRANPIVADSLVSLALVSEAEGSVSEAGTRYAEALASIESSVRNQMSALSASQRIALIRVARRSLDHWIRFAPRVGVSGYSEILRFRGFVARVESAERILARRANGEDRRMLVEAQTAQRRIARLANQFPSTFNTAARAQWQREYADASATRERLTLELTKRFAPLRVALERLDLGVRDVQAQLRPDTALVDFLRVRDRYLAWIVRAKGDPARVDVGAADAIEKASADFVEAITKGRDARDPGTAFRRLVWAPVEALLGAGVRRVVICPDAALAAVPFAALPGGAEGRFLLDDLAISYVANAQDLVPRKDAPPIGRDALVVGGVDFDHADVGAKSAPGGDRPSALASVDRAPRGDTFAPIPQTKIEAEALRDRFGRDATTLLIGTSATESRVREAAKGKRFVHVATHGFAREDLLAGLYTRKIEESFVSADAERQLAVGHDPMLLSGLALAGANPREGAAGDDGVLTALEASYIDLDGVDLVTLSACETARGTPESGEGVQGLVQAFQMAGARGVVASLWRVDDEGTRRLMDGLYERLLRPGTPLAAADALREAALALRESKDATGAARFAAPRYWAAFVSYGR